MPIPSGVAHLSRGGNAFPAVASKGRWAMSMREEKRVALGTVAIRIAASAREARPSSTPAVPSADPSASARPTTPARRQALAAFEAERILESCAQAIKDGDALPPIASL